MLGNSLMGVRIDELRVPALVFNYPRHLRATDEGMTRGSSILAYLVSAQVGRLLKGWQGP
jgi:hypothetical protein